MSQPEESLGYRMPAEWEEHVATWLGWPHHASDFPGKQAVIPWVFAEMIRYLAEGERVRLLYANRAMKAAAESVLKRAHVDLSRVDWLKSRTDRTWTRDYLPTFVTKSEISYGASSKLAKRRLVASLAGNKALTSGAVKWRFNGWARYPNHKLDDASGVLVAERFAKHALYPAAASGRRIVLEGGAIDTDGQGTLLTTESCLLQGKRARGKSLGKGGYEAIFRKFLGIERTIWLEEGIAGDDTSGHIDDFCRFVAPSVVVLCEELRKKDENYGPLSRAAKVLSKARDAEGKALTVVRLPMPTGVHFGRFRLPASYANFYIANRAVLVPTFNDPSDRVALSILEELFGDRPVIGIHASDLVLGLGTLHCSTQQQPRG